MDIRRTRRQGDGTNLIKLSHTLSRETHQHKEAVTQVSRRRKKRQYRMISKMKEHRKLHRQDKSQEDQTYQHPTGRYPKQHQGKPPPEDE